MIIKIIYSVLIFLGLVSSVLIILILTQKKRHNIRVKKIDAAREYFFKKYIDKEDLSRRISDKFFVDSMIDVDEQVVFDPEVRERLDKDISETKFIKKQIKRLKSKSKFKRLVAVHYLGRIKTRTIQRLLISRFREEKSEAVKLNIAQNLLPEDKVKILGLLMESFVGSSENYHKRLATIIGNRTEELAEIIEEFKNDRRYEIILGLLRIAEFQVDGELIAYHQDILEWLIEDKPFSEEQNQQLKTLILKNLLKYLPESLSSGFCESTNDLTVKKYSTQSIATNPSIECLDKLISQLEEQALGEIVVKTIESIIFEEKLYLDHILGIFHKLSQVQKNKLSPILAPRIDYIILKLANQNPKLLEEIIEVIFQQKIIEPIIDFLNKNPNEEIEDIVLDIIKLNLSSDLNLTREFRAYVKPEILAKIGLNALALDIETKEKATVEKEKIIWIVKWLFFTLLLFPTIYLLTIAKDISQLGIVEILTGFVIEVNVYLIFYFITINLIYVILLFLALKGSKEQVELAKTKKYSLLFSDNLLPGISIIAPAYNEEISIIDSVTSLLNLKYPNYEVIVVNDGSKDDTLIKLIEHFELERKHYSYDDSLSTKKVRGIYICKNIPNLVVVDKNNGGKADALNVGINISSKPFVCGIDADSILESDSLLKLASVMLDDTTPHLAMGGNIYPANGFTFNRGQVETYGIPKEIICRLQTIEYLRAFTSGRIGWSQLRSLMIISGAFGLFHKDTLIRIGGYLTISGSLKKDTVGEDMELVVRLTRDALERKEPHRVVYIYNAYCYTELPSDLKTLSKQRNRWQRGLIDILSYHRKLSLKPKYKQIGFIGYPYFFIFEFLGPFFEMFGYLMLIVALIFGLLNLEIILAIFTASIGFGIVISLFSLLMSEKEIKLMSAKETFILLLYAFIENFGYRQYISLHRVFSSFSALKESGQWGAQKRKGFKK